MLIEKFEDIYHSLHDNNKQVKKWFHIALIILVIYFAINGYTNYDIDYIILKLIYIGLTYMAILVLVHLFHKLFGKWMLHKKNLRLSKDYVSHKMPRSIKVDGYRGAGKDSTFNAIRKVLQKNMSQLIQDELELIEMLCYPYDFIKLNKALDENHLPLLTNSKYHFFKTFKSLLIEHDCFIKDVYKKGFDKEAHLQDFEKIKKDPFNDDFKNINFKYNNGITIQHYINLLIKYAIGYIRLNYLNNFIISNQPMSESKDITAKIFSTSFTNIQKQNAQWPWPLDGRFIITETEADAFYPNVGGKKGDSPMKSGLRNFKAFFRHFFGEDAVWINIGQNASRTNKQLRELDHAFIKVIEQSKVYGGEKRIYLLERLLTWTNFWINKSIRKKSKERQIRRRAKIYEKIRRLENSGYIYADIKVSRDDHDTKAEEMSVKQLLKHDKKIHENYKVKLCFTILECYQGYNTYYIEAVAEIMARKSKINFADVKNWSKDLQLKKSDIEYMAYPVLDDAMGSMGVKKDEKKKKQKD